MRDDQFPRLPMRGRYFVRHPAFNALFRIMDSAARLVLKWVPRPSCATDRLQVRKILIANGAHLGDIVLATSVLPALKQRFPGAQLGMLVGSWSRPVIDQHPLLDWIHTVDHWKASRACGGLIR
jgi:hypothetical protein